MNPSMASSEMNASMAKSSTVSGKAKWSLRNGVFTTTQNAHTHCSLTGRQHHSQSNKIRPLSTRRQTCNSLSLRLVQNVGRAHSRQGRNFEEKGNVDIRDFSDGIRQASSSERAKCSREISYPAQDPETSDEFRSARERMVWSKENHGGRSHRRTGLCFEFPTKRENLQKSPDVGPGGPDIRRTPSEFLNNSGELKLRPTVLLFLKITGQFIAEQGEVCSALGGKAQPEGITARMPWQPHLLVGQRDVAAQQNLDALSKTLRNADRRNWNWSEYLPSAFKVIFRGCSERTASLGDSESALG